MYEFRDPDSVLGARKIYIGSGRTSLHAVFGGSRYRQLYCLMCCSRGYKRAREEARKCLMRE
jgi:hypothetical protein